MFNETLTEYRCVPCNMPFTTRKKFTAHARLRHGPRSDSPFKWRSLKRFPCRPCKVEFKSLGELNGHQAERHGVRLRP